MATMEPRRGTTTTLLKLTAIAATAGLALAGCASGPGGGTDGGTEKVTLVFASHTAENSGEMQEVQWWVDRVNELTDGALDFQASYSGSLVPAADEFAAVRDGRIDAAYTAAFYNPAEFPLSQVAGIPFVTDDAYAHTTALDELFESNEAFNQEYLGQNVRPLFFIALGSSAIGSKSPVSTVDDLKGLKIRSGGLLVNALQVAGAEPVAMGFDEVYQALERGVIDAYSAAQMTSAHASGLFEVAPYLSNAGIGNYVASSFTINEDYWQSLPQSIRDAMEQASQEARTERTHILADEATAVCDAIIADGGEVIAWSPDEVQKWKDLVGDEIVDLWIKNVGDAGIDAETARSFYDEFVEKVESLKAESDYTDPMTLCSQR